MGTESLLSCMPDIVNNEPLILRARKEFVIGGLFACGFQFDIILLTR